MDIIPPLNTMLLTISSIILTLLLSIIGFYLKKLVTTVDRLSTTVTRDNEKNKGQGKQIEQNRQAILKIENTQNIHNTCANFKPRINA